MMCVVSTLLTYHTGFSICTKCPTTLHTSSMPYLSYFMFVSAFAYTPYTTVIVSVFVCLRSLVYARIPIWYDFVFVFCGLSP